jgi:type IV pilus assembly protein PilY1
MKKLQLTFRPLLLCLGLIGLAAPALAEDIDIYSGLNANIPPNVLIVLDNSANWSTDLPPDPLMPDCKYKENGVYTSEGPKTTNPGKETGKKMALEKCALYNLIDALPVKENVAGIGPHNDAKFSVGFMLLNESPNNGAYPRRAFTLVSTENKRVLKDIIKGLNISDDKGSNADFAKAMYEAYLYFKGAAPYQGTAGSKWDRNAVSGGLYNSPSRASCGQNHLIFIANGSPESSENGAALALLRAAGGDTSMKQWPTSSVKTSDQANWADEFARFMRDVDVGELDGKQGIITHGVAVVGASSDGLYPGFIKAMSSFGGTYHEASKPDVLVDALLAIFNELQDVDSVFAAASLPVSVNARGTYLNQVYMGMFRPDANSKPRWRGNLKQYKFGLDDLGMLSLLDSADKSAVSSTSGFISKTAISYWTSSSSFWTNQLMGTPASASDAPDGEVVEKGAAAQRIRAIYPTSQDARKVYTCVDCSNNTLLAGNTEATFATSNSRITTALLNVASSSRDTLIDWVRGTNNATDELGTGPTTTPATTIRPSVHGDVLHSRPAVVNYGGSTGVVVFYGANDGMLHAVNGNQTGSEAGNELWSFVPQEMYPKLNRLRNNSPIVKLSTTITAGAEPRGYFIDGPIGLYQKFNADMTINRVIIYVGMRRGGRLLYAFDVTNPNAPIFLWKQTGSDIARLGQTWSEPKVTRVRGYSSPVLVVGGGYDDVAEDAATPGTTTMGNRVFVFDALTGTELRAFTTERSVAADVTLVDSDFDGYVDRAYAVDLGGKVYRMDFETNTGIDKADWSVYTLADLAGGTSSQRKFFFGPDAVVTKSFTALMFGSGDREKPLLAATQDHFFQIFDPHVGKGQPADYLPTSWEDLSASSSTSSITGRGCYVPLATGEKVVNAATSIAGATYFGTNRPSDALVSTSSCTGNLGVAKSYAMPLFCVSPTGEELNGGGLPPSPVTGIVTVPKPGTNVSQQVPFCIGCPNPKKSGIEGSRIDPVIKVPRNRLYWYQETNR